MYGRDSDEPCAMSVLDILRDGDKVIAMTKNVQRLIRLTPQQDDRLRRMAFRRRVSVAEIIRQIIEARLRRN
jgi:predicted DNA-binding protein